ILGKSFRLDALRAPGKRRQLYTSATVGPGCRLPLPIETRPSRSWNSIALDAVCRVDDVENAVQRAIALGGSIIADPFVVSALRE
ncbi:MAG: hypothetical protein WBZ08_24370, partial [Pseudolabrys sp.]